MAPTWRPRGPPCGGGSPTRVSTECTATLSGPSGAKGGKFTCTISAEWQSSNDQGGVSITYGTAGQTDPATDAAVGFTGEPQARTYALTDRDAKGGVTVVVPFSPSPGATSYAEWASLNGTLDSTMPALAGYAIGTVALP